MSILFVFLITRLSLKKMKNVLLIGNSKQLENRIFVEKTNIKFDQICRFTLGWAHIYDKIKKHSGKAFDTLVLHYYCHDAALNELRKYKLIHNVKNIMMMAPKLSHTLKPVKYASGIPYEKLTKNDFRKIHKVLIEYGFPLSQFTPRTGIITIIYLSFLKNCKVYLLGFDVEGIDSVSDQHIETEIKLSPDHTILHESRLLQKLIKEGRCCLYYDI